MNWLPDVGRRSLALPLAVVAALAVFIINELTYHRSKQALQDVAAQTQLRVQVQTVLRLLLDAETGKRGYMLTGRQSYLEPYQQAVGEAEQLLRDLARDHADDPEVGASVVELRDRGREKMSELATALAMYEAGKREASRELMLTDIGREKMEAVREAADRLFAIQNRRVEMHRDDLRRNFQVSRLGVHTVVALSLLSLLLYLRQRAAFDRVQVEHAGALRAERDQLEAEVGRRTEEVIELARHMQAVREDERAHLARELHDELGALLTAAKLDAARLKRGLGDMKPEVAERLRHLNAAVDQCIALKRDIIENLRPSSLSNLGLVAALDIQAREFAEGADVQVTTELQKVPLTDAAQITISRLVQESLTNVAKYAQASQVRVTLQSQDGQACITVRDDGRGFDPAQTRRSTHGLRGMRFRVEAAGGRMAIASAPGQGTTITAWLPLADEAGGTSGEPAKG